LTIKIFIGPCEIAGYYKNLQKGFIQLGLNADYFTYFNSPFGYSNNIKLPFLLKIVHFFNNHKRTSGNIIIKILLTLPAEVFSFIWGFYAIFKYDVFIFGFGVSLLRFNIDLYILKLLGKKVISNIAHGSEARPAYINGANQNKVTSKLPNLNKLLKLIKTSKNLVSRHEKLATFIIGAPFSTSHFSSQKFINSFMIGIPSLECNFKNFESERIIKKSIRILHSPSHSIAKGTPEIKNAILNLQKKGYLIEFVLIKDMPNKKVIEEIKKCDFVIDQIYSDTPLAGFAAEAAFYGKPSVVGGYGFEYLKNFIPNDMFPPSKICHPDKIENAIESLIINNQERLLLGKAAQNFVLTKWNSLEVAKRYLRIIENDIPENWWLHPNEVIYIEGAGQSLNVTKNNIKNILKKKGINGLKLGNHKKREEAFLSFYMKNSMNIL